MAGGEEVRPLTVDEAKDALLREDPQSEPAGLRGWVLDHPKEAVAAAAGIGVVMVLFPRLRRLAIPAIAAMARLSLL
jgi:hypothetical protein